MPKDLTGSLEEVTNSMKKPEFCQKLSLLIKQNTNKKYVQIENKYEK